MENLGLVPLGRRDVPDVGPGTEDRVRPGVVKASDDGLPHRLPIPMA